MSLSSVAEAARAEDVTSQMAAVDESDWVHVDPYSDDLQGMIHPTSRMFRASLSAASSSLSDALLDRRFGVIPSGESNPEFCGITNGA